MVELCAASPHRAALLRHRRGRLPVGSLARPAGAVRAAREPVADQIPADHRGVRCRLAAVPGAAAGVAAIADRHDCDLATVATRACSTGRASPPRSSARPAPRISRRSAVGPLALDGADQAGSPRPHARRRRPPGRRVRAGARPQRARMADHEIRAEQMRRAAGDGRDVRRPGHGRAWLGRVDRAAPPPRPRSTAGRETQRFAAFVDAAYDGCSTPNPSLATAQGDPAPPSAQRSSLGRPVGSRPGRRCRAGARRGSRRRAFDAGGARRAARLQRRIFVAQQELLLERHRWRQPLYPLNQIVGRTSTCPALASQPVRASPRPRPGLRGSPPCVRHPWTGWSSASRAQAARRRPPARSRSTRSCWRSRATCWRARPHQEAGASPDPGRLRPQARGAAAAAHSASAC